MKIRITKASDGWVTDNIEIREVEPLDLVELIDEFKCGIIVQPNGAEEFMFTGKVVNGENEIISLGVIDYNVTIYDDYVE